MKLKASSTTERSSNKETENLSSEFNYCEIKILNISHVFSKKNNKIKNLF